MNNFKTYVSIAVLAVGFNAAPLSAQQGGVVRAWGWNHFGQLGNGTTTDSSVPVQALGLFGAVRVRGSGDVFRSHSLAQKSDGTVWAWGSNTFGELGNGSQTPASVPIQVPGLSGIVAIGAGLEHSVAVKSDGTVWAWGANEFGQLGKGSSSNFDKSTVPVQAVGLSGAVAAEAGNLHTVALKLDGTVWGWGQNGNGQLGNGTVTLANAPVQIPSFGGVVAIAAGAFHTLALKSDGTMWGWGSNNAGQLGSVSVNGVEHSPVQVPGLTNVIAIAAGDGFSLALKSDGTVWAWGWNGEGELGLGFLSGANPTPVQVPGLSGVVAIAAGKTNGLALKSGGTVWAWGYNADGEVGNGTMTDSTPSPVQVSGLTSPIAIAGGGKHALAIVLPTLSGVRTEFGAIVAAGCIDSSGIANDLTSKFADAQTQITAGNIQGAINTLNGLLNQLEAQSDKHILPSCTVGGATFDPGPALVAEVQALLAILKSGGTV